jgi:protein TonB
VALGLSLAACGKKEEAAPPAAAAASSQQAAAEAAAANVAAKQAAALAALSADDLRTRGRQLENFVIADIIQPRRRRHQPGV